MQEGAGAGVCVTRLRAQVSPLLLADWVKTAAAAPAPAAGSASWSALGARFAPSLWDRAAAFYSTRAAEGLA